MGKFTCCSPEFQSHEPTAGAFSGMKRLVNKRPTSQSAALVLADNNSNAHTQTNSSSNHKSFNDHDNSNNYLIHAFKPQVHEPSALSLMNLMHLFGFGWESIFTKRHVQCGCILAGVRALGTPPGDGASSLLLYEP